ncbi:MAG: MBL fold metallo-hydrolase [Nostocaceae cyanobacterium]|nr:MBL fold metallo-hydrolase [Nostocaceae cyanobacterium]
MSNSQLSSPQNNLTRNQDTLLSNQQDKFTVQFWGVRGLIPSPGTNTNRYGGNTACVEMHVAGKRLIFDGGTGLRLLGKNWLKLQQPIEAHLFFTNSQLNRIQGFPFFAPAFIRENSFHIYGTPAFNGASIKQCLCNQMIQPHFPYPLQVMQSDLHFHNLTPDREINLDDVTVKMALINHNQNSIGYRVDWQNYSVGYLTDLHTNANEIEQKRAIELSQGVDLLIANSTYTPPRFNHCKSGESHWQTAVDLAQTAGVKQLVISHHHPDDDDDFLDQIQIEMKSAFSEALLGHEGLILVVI